MPVESQILSPGTRGANNKARPDALPEGYVRDMVNFIPAGNGLSLRPGYEKALAGTNVTGAVPFGDDLLVCDDNVVYRLTPSGGATQVGSVADGTPFVGDTMDGVAYIVAGNTTLLFDGQTLRPWGVPEVTAPPAIPGTDPSGPRRLAFTYVDPYGVEGGCVRSYPAGSGLMTPVAPAGYTVNVYATEKDGSVFYLQGTASGNSSFPLTTTNPAGRPLVTMDMRRPPAGSKVVCHGGMVFIASGRYVFHTEPMRPTLVNPVAGSFQFGEKVGDIVAGLGGVYILSDKCRVLTGAGTDELRQAGVFNYGAVPGSAGVARDGRAFWMTRYGLAMEQQGPRGPYVAQLGEEAFVPRTGQSGYSGSVEVNGEQLVISGVKAPADTNPLAASGYFEAEVERP